ncbi:MAG: phytanoyl-CoA dioxygenase family protein [Chloroflexota bacterium]
MTVATAERVYDTGGLDPYPDGLYQTTGIAQGVNGFENVTAANIEQFFTQGYLVIHNAFTSAEIQSAKDGLLYLMAGKNPDFTGFHFEKKAEGVEIEGLPIESRQDYVRKFWRFVEYEDRLKALSEHPKLLSTIRQIMGGEDPLLFQDMALLKPPRIGREKPWHQDHAYFQLPLETVVVGAWIALDEATIDNGCMVVNPGSNREGPVVHFQRRDWQICDTHINNLGAIAVPLKPGGCLLFSSYTQHGTPVNKTNQRRRALQFHYKPVSAGAISQDERLAVFGSEGKDVTC